MINQVFLVIAEPGKMERSNMSLIMLRCARPIEMGRFCLLFSFLGEKDHLHDTDQASPIPIHGVAFFLDSRL
jgi:hypothetical protein